MPLATQCATVHAGLPVTSHTETVGGSRRTGEAIVCPQCAKVIDTEPNFCPACGVDLRGLSPTSNTLSGHLSGTLIDDRYKILEKLGEGGMGAVYKVEHVRMGKILALKILRPDSALDKGLKARFMQEARVVAKLSHTNTVQVFDSGELQDGGLYIAMEYLPGRDLSWHLRSRGALTEEKAIGVAIQVLGSLEEAHALGIVHRDLKPANIMLVRRKGADDQVKLLDFGIAKLLEAEGRKSITNTGTTGIHEFIGTPAYMSPEQGKGDPLDARTDLYSLGAVLFELVTGRCVFVGRSPMEVVTMHMTTVAPRVTDITPDKPVSGGFEAVLRKALCKDPDERFSSAEQMRIALEKVRRDMGALPNDFTPLPEELTGKMASRADFDHFERNLKAQRYLAPLAALLVMLAIGLAGWAWYQSTHKPSGRFSAEVEPNNEPNFATPISVDTDVKGAINAVAEGEKNDRDLYVVDVPAGPIRVTLSGVKDLNLFVELLQPNRANHLDSVVMVDDVGVGHPERLDAVQLRAGPLYLRVEEGPFFEEPNRPPRETALVPYPLRVEPMPGGPFEEEPNDSISTAQDCPLTRSLTGFTGPQVEYPDRAITPMSSVDNFRVGVSGENEKVAVMVVPPPAGKLLVIDGVALETWQAKKASATTPAAKAIAPPRPVVVEGKPELVVLSAAGGRRLVRIQSGEGSEPGSAYRFTFLTSDSNGLAGVLDLARSLEQEQRGPERLRVLELAANAFADSPQALELRQLLR
ncbi:MAG: serine/threonine protein kinase [Myxococcaceae bacterium]|nr:serine/threonine protein kinase [Myxococcaceae bacterium]